MYWLYLSFKYTNQTNKNLRELFEEHSSTTLKSNKNQKEKFEGTHIGNDSEKIQDSF